MASQDPPLKDSPQKIQNKFQKMNPDRLKSGDEIDCFCKFFCRKEIMVQ
jgi:hypothetical protein